VSSIGVLGTATWGVGVWGHSGPLAVPADAVPTGFSLVDVPMDLVQQPGAAGGVFSAGELGVRNGHQVSTNRIPQIRLIPGVSNTAASTLPTTARLGDIYVGLTSSEGNPTVSCAMFLCVRTGDGDAGWGKFKLGPVQFVP
jgi:hypothetical protein